MKSFTEAEIRAALESGIEVTFKYDYKPSRQLVRAAYEELDFAERAWRTLLSIATNPQKPSVRLNERQTDLGRKVIDDRGLRVKVLTVAAALRLQAAGYELVSVLAGNNRRYSPSPLSSAGQSGFLSIGMALALALTGIVAGTSELFITPQIEKSKVLYCEGHSSRRVQGKFIRSRISSGNFEALHPVSRTHQFRLSTHHPIVTNDGIDLFIGNSSLLHRYYLQSDRGQRNDYVGESKIPKLVVVTGALLSILGFGCVVIRKVKLGLCLLIPGCAAIYLALLIDWLRQMKA
jgi:hypothetical protein